jgi:hypothetical protein
MKKLRSQILQQLHKPMTESQLIAALRTDYGVKITLQKMVSEGLIYVQDFRYKIK